MSKRLYVAYGSNLNLRQMKQRCPTAKLYGTGIVKDYELQFKGSPTSAFATIAPKEGSSVPAAVWEIQPQDERSLDRYEGYPSHYFKQNVPVELDSEEVNAMVYIMNLKMKFGMPSLYYYATVMEGYKDCKLDTNVLEKALTNSAQEYYLSAVQFPEEQTLIDFDDDQDESEEEISEEQNENDPFYYFDGMHW